MIKNISIAVVITSIMLWCLGSLMDRAMADVTGAGATTNTQSTTGSSASNTAITGGYHSESTTNFQSGSSSNTTTTNTTNNSSYTGDTRTATSVGNSGAIANMNQDVCSISLSAGITKPIIGFSVSGHYTDENCVMLKQVRLLNNLGLKTAAVARMCLHSEEIFRALLMSGSYCPAYGLVGQEAEEFWKKYWELRPDKETYIATEKIIEKVDQKAEKKDEGQSIHYSGGTVKLGRD